MPITDLRALPPARLVPLFAGTWRLAEYRALGATPAGTRVIIEMPEGRIEGERVKGRAVGGTTADWFLIGPDGTGTIDFRGTLETDDGATIYMHGSGRCDMRGGVGEAGVLYGAPMFETGHERYAWLNRVQAVFRGVVAGDGMFYDEYFELRWMPAASRLRDLAVRFRVASGDERWDDLRCDQRWPSSRCPARASSCTARQWALARPPSFCMRAGNAGIVWSPVARALEDAGCSSVAYDLRAHGDSAGGPAERLGPIVDDILARGPELRGIVR